MIIGNMEATKIPIGVNYLSNIGVEIAKFLGNDDDKTKKFTTHFMRRTGASNTANSGGSILDLKAQGNWKSSVAAEGYIQKSDVMKRKFA